ncbi:hypothetical protein V2A60_008489 [Cordyceps javanica]|uniref:BAG domain-containing protein n=1 Tax=Cordyceps javanica TaxID=43265 RepID=A0A545VPJ7_9HYPO|nr:BAG domain-containing protein [Cordyceps javanica]TQW03669.1 BAG domain protein [Cordyceps javanica]
MRHTSGYPTRSKVIFPYRVTLPPDDKVDSTRAAVASSGALHNIGSYITGTLDSLSATLDSSNHYIASTLGLHPSLVYTAAAALVAVPVTMSRYGWSRSPYSSQPGGVPTVSEDDYAYITSQDLDDHGLGSSASARPQHSPAAADADVLLVKSRGVNYPLHFPRHSIADGKLQVRDIAERARLIMSLSDRELRSLRFIYRGRQLKEPLAPVRDYGVKDNSTLMAVLPDRNDRADHSDEETVVVNESKSQRKNKRRKAAKKRNAGDADQPSSPNDSASNGGAKSPSPVPGAAGQRRIDEIAADFNAKWLPVCSEYIAKPPADPRKRVDEHTRLSETVLQHVLLKLDEVDTEGNQDVRQSRKDLIHTVQEVLRKMDTARGPVDN